MIPKHIIESHQNGDFQKALDYYLERLEREPGENIWPALIGVIHAQRHEYTLAYDYLKRSVACKPTADNLSQLATICLNLGKWDEAEHNFNQSLTLKPFAPRLHNNYGIYYLKRNDYENAKTHFYMSLSQDGTISEAYFNLGLCHMHLGEIEQAQHRFEQAISLDPKHHASHYQLGLALELSEQWEQASSHYQLCLALVEHEAASHGQGRCLLKLGEASDALVHLKKSFVLGGEGLELWHNMGMCYLQLSSPALALEAWSKAAQFEKNIDVLYHLGVCYQQMMRYEDAEIYFVQALTLEPNHLETHLNLIAISIERFQVEKALGWIRQALSFYPDREDLIYLEASLTQTSTMTRAPASYVAQLFDHYAHHYDTHVVQHLQYQVPERLESILKNYKPKEGWFSACDLGCGTGLCGKIIRPHTQKLIGIDLSKDMLKIASLLAVYDHLIEKDIVSYLDEASETYDLMTLAEVLPYIGDLAWLMMLHKHIKAEGLVILSIEKDTTIEQYHLHEHARFTHNPNYVISCMIGFECLEMHDITLRKHMNKDVQGKLLVFKKINAS